VLLQAGALALTAAILAGQPLPPPASPWPDDRPFTRLFQNLGRDLRTLPSLPSVILLGAGGVGAAAAHEADDNIAEAARDSGAAGHTEFGDILGNGWVQGGAAAAAYVIGRVGRKPRVTHTGSDLIRAQILNGLITRALKVTVDRSRPTGSGHAFPSGHTSATFASAAVLHSHYGWKVGAPAYAVASFVGWSRVWDGQHWLSDVVFGAAVGLASGYTVTRGHRGPAWNVVPVRTSGGGAVFLVKRW
jgi:membrane-associated phospholipid phosphatase